MKKIYVFLSLALLFNLLFTGCETGEPTETLNLYSVGPLTLDPAISGETTSHQYVTQLFSGLVCLDDDLKPAPDIARKWQVSEDGRTYTFYLRKDVKFHDGREVKAGDFKYSWERACNPATGSQTAATYLGDIVGVEEVLTGRGTEIEGVKVIGDYTLEVNIDAPKAYFLSKLTYPTTFVVDQVNVESGNTWWRQPNGTGPFKLKYWEEEDLIILGRNEFYYGELARVNSVTYSLWSGVPLVLYETGRIDVVNVTTSYIDRVTDEAGPFYEQLLVVPELSSYYIGFNHSKPPFDDINIRRAFCQAIDKDKIASLVFRDMLQRADGILPSAMPGFNEALSGLDYDVDKARQLIADSKYGDVSNLPPITLTTAGSGGSIQGDLEAIIHEWRQNLGVEVEVRQLETERFLYHLEEEKDNLYYYGWVADYPHPQNFLDVLFHTDADYNYGEYSNPEVDELLDRANLETDSSLGLYQQAEQKLVDDVACIPLWFGQNHILVKPYVDGYELNPMGVARLNLVSVEPH